jgi:hypothetical protein
MPGYNDLLAAARRFAPSALLPTLAQVSTEQVSRRTSSEWPDPWNIALIARECIAYSNEHRRGGPVTDRDLKRLRELTRELDDPYADSKFDADAWESLKVRYSYLQIPFQTHQPLSELSRLLSVCGGDDAYYSRLGLEVVTANLWSNLIGMPLATFAKAGFVIVSLARTNHGRFDAAELIDAQLKRYGVSATQVMHVFNTYFGAELGDLRIRAAADRNTVPSLRRLDTNPLLERPFVRLDDGQYIAPSMHLAESRLSLSAIYYIGIQAFGEAFARDMGKLIEAYVGRQLSQLDRVALLPEQPYGTRGHNGMTCDWILSIDGTTIIFEVKSARIAQQGRVGATEHFSDMRRDVGKALGKQIPITVGLIKDRTSVFAGFDLPTDIYGVVITAEPHLRINRQYYRDRLPDPGCPYVVLSLADLEWFVASLRAGLDPTLLIRELTSSTYDLQEVISEVATSAGIREIPPNPLVISVAEEVSPRQRR